MKYGYLILIIVLLLLLVWVVNKPSKQTVGTQEAPHSLQTAPEN